MLRSYNAADDTADNYWTCFFGHHWLLLRKKIGNLHNFQGFSRFEKCPSDLSIYSISKLLRLLGESADTPESCKWYQWQVYGKSYDWANFHMFWSIQLISTAETVFFAWIHYMFSLISSGILNWEAWNFTQLCIIRCQKYFQQKIDKLFFILSSWATIMFTVFPITVSLSRTNIDIFDIPLTKNSQGF